jgi:hypothetical protein
LKKGQRIRIFLVLAVFVCSSACGKKAPPFLPDKDLSLRVEQLTAERQGGKIFLKGKVVNVKSRPAPESDLGGCNVYYAFYAPDNLPCEGCPIAYRLFGEIRQPVVAQGRFVCQISVEEKPGVHFFEVRLVGPGGEVGPSSDKARLTIGN